MLFKHFKTSKKHLLEGLGRVAVWKPSFPLRTLGSKQYRSCARTKSKDISSSWACKAQAIWKSLGRANNSVEWFLSFSKGFWMFMVVFGCFWWFLLAFLNVFDCSSSVWFCRFLVVVALLPVVFDRFLVVFGRWVDKTFPPKGSLVSHKRHVGTITSSMFAIAPEVYDINAWWCHQTRLHIGK